MSNGRNDLKYEVLGKTNQIYLLHLQLQTFILFTYGEMWLLNKISCEIQILNEKVWKLMIENSKLAEENKKLKEELETATKCSSQEEWKLRNLEKENKKLKEENGNLKAIIEHYKKFEEWKEKLEWMLMEEDTLQELKDIWKL